MFSKVINTSCIKMGFGVGGGVIHPIRQACARSKWWLFVSLKETLKKTF